MKHTVVLVFAFVILFSLPSRNADGQDCSLCSNWRNGNVLITDCSQGSSALGAFDHEYPDYVGYCLHTNTTAGFIFELDCCDYEEQLKIIPGKAYIIEVGILTPGVYWSNKNYSKNSNVVGMQVHSNKFDICNYINLDNPRYETAFEVDTERYCPHADSCSQAAAPLKLILGSSYTCDQLYFLDQDLGISRHINAKKVRTKPGRLWPAPGDVDYIPEKHADLTNPYLLFDVPSFVYDPKQIPEATELQIRITISDASQYGCETCNYDPICSKIYSAGKLSRFACGNPSCIYSLSSTFFSFSSESGSGFVHVTAYENCSWSAMSHSSWLEITSGSVGTGSGTVNFTVKSNPAPCPGCQSTQRIGTMSVAGQTITVNQDGTAQQDSSVPVMRFRNTLNGHFILTANYSESESLKNSINWVYEGIMFYVPTMETAESSAVYRFYNISTEAYFYTISAQERDIVMSDYPDFRYEGIAYYAFQKDTSDRRPLFRFLNTATGSHFYTASLQERDLVLQNYPQFEDEGVAYYVYED